VSDSETIVRFVRLRPELRPVPILGGDGEPVQVDWIALTRSLYTVPGTVGPYEGYVLYLLTDAGEHSEVLQFDTLPIAIDQAHAILGIARDEWSPCDVVLESDSIPWSLVSQRH
jgi:hypothetical protein